MLSAVIALYLLGMLATKSVLDLLAEESSRRGYSAHTSMDWALLLVWPIAVVSVHLMELRALWEEEEE